MRLAFEGITHESVPLEWNERTKDNFLLNKDFLDIIRISGNLRFRLITHPEYCCAEYDIRLNLLSFSRFSLPVTITVIGVPVSIGKRGYIGNIDALINDYSKRKGIYLILNDDGLLPNNRQGTGKTLPTCMFYNNYDSFLHYINALRSPYRRRIVIALKKGEPLSVKQIKSSEFTEDMYKLYTEVVSVSKYSLEILSADFFKLFEGDILCFYNGYAPVAFVLLKGIDDTLYFVFGGMDYNKRDKFDLYYNMLLLIIKKGIEGKFTKIDFGQTAELSKLRVGCRCQNKYMHIFAGNKIIDFLLKHLIVLFDYKFKAERLNVFKNV